MIWLLKPTLAGITARRRIICCRSPFQPFQRKKVTAAFATWQRRGSISASSSPVSRPDRPSVSRENLPRIAQAYVDAGKRIHFRTAARWGATAPWNI